LKRSYLTFADLLITTKTIAFHYSKFKLADLIPFEQFQFSLNKLHCPFSDTDFSYIWIYVYVYAVSASFESLKCEHTL